MVVSSVVPSALSHQKLSEYTMGGRCIHRPLHGNSRLPRYLPVQAYKGCLGHQHQGRMHQLECDVNRHSVFERCNGHCHSDFAVTVGLAIAAAESSEVASMWDLPARKLVS